VAGARDVFGADASHAPVPRPGKLGGPSARDARRRRDVRHPRGGCPPGRQCGALGPRHADAAPAGGGGRDTSARRGRRRVPAVVAGGPRSAVDGGGCHGRPTGVLPRGVRGVGHPCGAAGRRPRDRRVPRPARRAASGAAPAAVRTRPAEPGRRPAGRRPPPRHGRRAGPRDLASRGVRRRRGARGAPGGSRPPRRGVPRRRRDALARRTRRAVPRRLLPGHGRQHGDARRPRPPGCVPPRVGPPGGSARRLPRAGNRRRVALPTGRTPPGGRRRQRPRDGRRDRRGRGCLPRRRRGGDRARRTPPPRTRRPVRRWPRRAPLRRPLRRGWAPVSGRHPRARRLPEQRGGDVLPERLWLLPGGAGARPVGQCRRYRHHTGRTRRAGDDGRGGVRPPAHPRLLRRAGDPPRPPAGTHGDRLPRGRGGGPRPRGAGAVGLPGRPGRGRLPRGPRGAARHGTRRNLPGARGGQTAWRRSVGPRCASCSRASATL
jgi:hypothetical protein